MIITCLVTSHRDWLPLIEMTVIALDNRSSDFWQPYKKHKPCTWIPQSARNVSKHPWAGSAVYSWWYRVLGLHFMGVLIVSTALNVGGLWWWVSSLTTKRSLPHSWSSCFLWDLVGLDSIWGWLTDAWWSKCLVGMKLTTERTIGVVTRFLLLVIVNQISIDIHNKRCMRLKVFITSRHG